MRLGALALALMLPGTVALDAGAQGKAAAKDAPASSASAAPRKDKDASKGNDARAEGDAGALPPGHPQVDPSLPAGHPAIDDDDSGDDDDDQPPPNPHERNPHGGKAGDGKSELFEPPPDTSEDDASLAPGVIEIAVVDAKGQPIPKVPLTLGVLHSSVARGDSQEHRASTADEHGVARFEHMEIGLGVSYNVSITRGGATFAMHPFALAEKAGKKVTLHVYPASSNLNDVLMGMQGMVYLQLKEDSITVEHLFTVFNVGPTAWLPSDVTIDLPAGFKAFNKPDGTEDARFEEVGGKGATLLGTIGPGRHELNFRYQVPLDEESTQVLKIAMPPHVAQVRVVVEASKHMGLEVAGFPQAQRSQNREGKRILITERQASRADGGMRDLEITLTGLPTPGLGRWIALGLGATALLGGGAYVLRRREDDEASDEARRELREARDALLDEIVALERAHKAGDVGPKTYPRLRAALLDALARIVAMLNATKRPRGGYRGPPESTQENA